MKFRSRKDPQQSIVIPSKHWGQTQGEFAHMFNCNVLRGERGVVLPSKLEYDSRLVATKDG
mgnify:CR=1 FL=1